MLSEQQKKRLSGFVTSDIYRIIEKIGEDIIKRSWMMRKTRSTADETLKTVSFGEGIESGVKQLLELINKYSK